MAKEGLKMIRLMSKIPVFLLAVIFLFFASEAFAAEITFSVSSDNLWVRLADGKPAGTPIPSGPAEQENGLEIYGPEKFFNGMGQSDARTVFWLAVIPENNAVNEGECGPVGIHFYDESIKKYSFIQLQDNFSFQNLAFTWDMTKILVNSMDSCQIISFPDLKSESCGDSSSRGAWLDENRLVLAEEKPNHQDNESPETSVVILDTRTGKKEILKQGTATSIYIPGIWSPGEITEREYDVLAGANINVTEISVNSPSDWEVYPEKAKAKILLVPIPQVK